MAGHRLWYESTGDGRPLVLLHGLAGSGRWWSHNVGRLARTCRVVTLDLPGFGSSHGSWPSVDESATIVAAAIEALGLEGVALVGHSMGGAVALELAARQPWWLARLVLVDASVFFPRKGLLANLSGSLRMISRLPRAFWPRLVVDSFRSGPRNLRRAAHEILSVDLRERFALVAQPTLVIWGERDAAVPLEVGQKLAEELPRARLEVLAGCGHVPMWECPERFEEVLLRFLAEPLSDRS